MLFNNYLISNMVLRVFLSPTLSPLCCLPLFSQAFLTPFALFSLPPNAIYIKFIRYFCIFVIKS